MAQAVIAIGDAELGGGNAELAVVGGDADIGRHRHLHAAAEAEAPDAGDDRLRIIRQQGALRLALFRIFFRRCRIVADFLELADIGARDERLVAGADHDHDADVGIVAQLDQRAAEPFPHIQRHRVALGGVVEGDDADAVADALQDLAVGIRFFVVFGNVEHGCCFRMLKRIDRGSDGGDEGVEFRTCEGRPGLYFSPPFADAGMFLGARLRPGAISSSSRLTNGTAAISAIE